MTPEDLKKLKTSLLEREKEIIVQLKEIAIENPAVKGDFEVKVRRQETEEEDPFDLSQNDADLERDFALERQLEDELKQVRVALQKIDQGTYGACEGCTKSVEDRRIQAIPVASLCINCARKSQPN